MAGRVWTGCSVCKEPVGVIGVRKDGMARAHRQVGRTSGGDPIRLAAKCPGGGRSFLVFEEPAPTPAPTGVPMTHAGPFLGECPDGRTEDLGVRLLMGGGVGCSVCGHNHGDHHSTEDGVRCMLCRLNCVHRCEPTRDEEGAAEPTADLTAQVAALTEALACAWRTIAGRDHMLKLVAEERAAWTAAYEALRAGAQNEAQEARAEVARLRAGVTL